MIETKSALTCTNCESMPEAHTKDKSQANLDLDASKKTLANVLMNDAAIFRGDRSEALPQLKSTLIQELEKIHTFVEENKANGGAANLPANLQKIDKYFESAKAGAFTMDDKYDADFEKAVKAYQAYNGLPETGIIGFRTARMLNCAENREQASKPAEQLFSSVESTPTAVIPPAAPVVQSQAVTQPAPEVAAARVDPPIVAPLPIGGTISNGFAVATESASNAADRIVARAAVEPTVQPLQPVAASSVVNSPLLPSGRESSISGVGLFADSQLGPVAGPYSAGAESLNSLTNPAETQRVEVREVDSTDFVAPGSIHTLRSVPLSRFVSSKS